ncbi:MAG: hypothetical protein ACE5OR_16295, partial [bacterium]
MVGFLTPREIPWDWSTVADYLERVEKNGPVLNVGTLLAHGAVRTTAMGMTRRPPTEEDYRTMEYLIAQSLDEGSFGISFGLIYPPGQYSTTDELKYLCKIAKTHGRYAAFHQRGGGSQTLVDSVNELIEIGLATGIPVHHSHEVAHGRGDWSAIDATIELKEKAVKRGVDITQDVIPYVSVCTTMLAIYPPWTLADGVSGLLEHLNNPSTRRKIKDDIESLTPQWPPWQEEGWPVNIVQDFGWENIFIAYVSGKNKKYEMKNISQIGHEIGRDPFDAISDIVVEEEGTVTQLIFGINGDRTTDEPLKKLLRLPTRALVTDAWDIGEGRPHP